MISEHARAARIPVRDIGFAARRVIDHGRSFRVGAVFERFLYLNSEDNRWFCVLNENAAATPLSIRCRVPVTFDWYSGGIHTGMLCSTGSETLSIGKCYVLLLSEAAIWSPPALPSWSSSSLGRGLKDLTARLRIRMPEDGLGVFSRSGTDTKARKLIADRGTPAIAALNDWLRNVMLGRSPPDWDLPSIVGLVGLGPGLTPSGDDFIGGILIALRVLGKDDSAMALYGHIRNEIENHCNPISAGYLAAASEGAGNENFHFVVNALLTGNADALESALNAINGIGHSSGWDGLAGIVTALSAWQDTQPNPPN